VCINHGREGEARRRKKEIQRKKVPMNRVQTEHEPGRFEVTSWGVGCMVFLPQGNSAGVKVATPRSTLANSPRRTRRSGEDRVKAVDVGEGAEGQVVTSTMLLGQELGE